MMTIDLRSVRAAIFGALVIVLVAAPSRVAAHDFWLEAAPWVVARGAIVTPGLNAGHAGDRAPWGGAPDRIVSFRKVSPAGATNVRSSLAFDSRRREWSGAIEFDAPGVHVLALETNDAFSVLPADKFDAYVTEEGLTLARLARTDARAKATPGRERYSRRAKALVFVEGGERETAPPQVGHLLEIVTLDSPFALAADEPLRLRIYYDGAPLPGASVKFESLSARLLPPRRAVTDAAGRVEFTLPKRGAWKASLVWTKPVQGDPEADFATVFASLTFALNADASSH